MKNGEVIEFDPGFERLKETTKGRFEVMSTLVVASDGLSTALEGKSQRDREILWDQLTEKFPDVDQEAMLKMLMQVDIWREYLSITGNKIDAVDETLEVPRTFQRAVYELVSELIDAFLKYIGDMTADGRRAGVDRIFK